MLAEINAGLPVTASCFQKVHEQLYAEDGVLMRSVKLPIGGLVTVPVIPDGLQEKVVHTAHINSGHGSWQTVYEILR